jgi:MOSC domain-containing protein YiiM
VSRKASHGVDKTNQLLVRLVTGYGVEGDAHFGERVKHRSRMRANPALPNLRQVHLLHEELFEELARKGFAMTPGLMGENITTRGVPLLDLSRGTRLRIGSDAIVELTGLRNPCLQLDALAPGLMAACLGRGPEGEPLRKAGVMAVVVQDGEVRPGDIVAIERPPHPYEALRPV